MPYNSLIPCLPFVIFPFFNFRGAYVFFLSCPLSVTRPRFIYLPGTLWKIALWPPFPAPFPIVAIKALIPALPSSGFKDPLRNTCAPAALFFPFFLYVKPLFKETGSPDTVTTAIRLPTVALLAFTELSLKAARFAAYALLTCGGNSFLSCFAVSLTACFSAGFAFFPASSSILLITFTLPWSARIINVMHSPPD